VKIDEELHILGDMYVAFGLQTGSKMQYLFIVRGSENYGVQRKLLLLMGNLLARGNEVRLLALGEGEFLDKARTIRGLQVDIGSAPPPRFVGVGWRKVVSFLKLLLKSSTLVVEVVRTLRLRPTDYAVFCEHGLILPILAACTLVKVRLVWLMPNMISGNYWLDINRRVYKFVFRYFNFIAIANSNATLASLGRASQFARKINLGVSVPAFAEAHDPIPEVPKGAFRLLIMARLVEGKGQHLLVEAISRSPIFDNIHLILCGGPLGTDYEARLRRTAESLGVGARVHIMGPTEDTARYYRHVDVVVSARVDAEPFGLSIVEAMMYGRPILAHALGGPSEIVLDGITGWLVEEATVPCFQRALERMLLDQPFWLSYGNAAMLRAKTIYSEEEMCDQFLAVIK
jgi:glycosyltransferase involved in cell wall biosynthesis